MLITFFFCLRFYYHAYWNSYKQKSLNLNMRQLLFLIFLFSAGLSFGQSEESLLRKSIYFGGGSYYIDRFQITELKQFMESVEDINNYEVILFSHTDPIGGKEYNEWLSMMRSQAVFHQLILMEIPEELIEIRDLSEAEN